MKRFTLNTVGAGLALALMAGSLATAQTRYNSADHGTMGQPMMQHNDADHGHPMMMHHTMMRHHVVMRRHVEATHRMEVRHDQDKH